MPHVAVLATATPPGLTREVRGNDRAHGRYETYFKKSHLRDIYKHGLEKTLVYQIKTVMDVEVSCGYTFLGSGVFFVVQALYTQ